MTGRELLEIEAKRFEALPPAEREEELRGQAERKWLIQKRDGAMILPSLPPTESPVMAVTAEERSSKSATEMPPAPLYFSPLF